jgi:hypothetical protein
MSAHTDAAELPLSQIMCRFSGAVRFEGRFGSLRLCVEAAVSARANLTGAYLAGAYLAGADLTGANLAGANLAGAYLTGANLAGAKVRMRDGNETALTGAHSLLQIAPIGSRASTLTIMQTEAGLLAQTGCFGPAPLADFEAAVTTSHGDTLHGRAYRAAVALARVQMEGAA